MNTALSEHDAINNILYHSPAIIFSLGMAPAIDITYISPNLKRILGYEETDFTSDHNFWLSQVHPDDRIRAREGFDGLMKSGHWAHEYRFRHKDGTYRWMLDELNVVYDDGVPKEIVGSWLDITEQVKERELQEQKQKRAKEYFDHAPMLFLTIDADGIVCDVNAYTRKILGYTNEEMIGKNWFHHFLPVAIRAEREWLFRSLILNKRVEADIFDGHVLTANGEQCIIRWRNIIVQGDEGNLYMILAGEEMTASILAQQKLEESEELYRLMALHTTDVIQKNDAQGIYTYISPSSETTLGFKPEELVGTSVYEYVHPDDYNKLQQLHLQVLSGMHESLVVTLRFRKKDGSYIWTEHNARIIYNEQGQMQESVSVLRDITLRKRMEQDLEEMGQLMMAIHEKLSVISFRVGADGNILRSFGKGLRKLGLSENEPFENNVFETFPQLKEYLRPGTWKDYFTVETSGVNEHQPWWFQHFFFRDINHDNELIGFAFDITDLKEAQTRLFETKEMYRLLVNSFPNVSVFVFDENLRFQFAEGQDLATNNWRSEDIVGKTLSEVYGDATDSPLYLTFVEAFKGIARVFEIERGGQTLQIHVTPIRGLAGEIVSAIAISQDITEKKQLEQMILKVAIVGNDLERKELSEKLHDGLGQKISSIKFKLELIDSELLASDPVQQELLAMSKKAINLVLTNLRELSNLMMPNVLSDFGLQAALEELCFNVNRKGNLKIMFESFELKQRQYPDVEMGLYRMVQELLRCFEKQEAPITLLMQLYEKSGHLFLRAEQTNVVDNNYMKYFENTSEFYNITSRTRALNGHLTVRTLSEKRTLITIEIPFAL